MSESSTKLSPSEFLAQLRTKVAESGSQDSASSAETLLQEIDDAIEQDSATSDFFGESEEAGESVDQYLTSADGTEPLEDGGAEVEPNGAGDLESLAAEQPVDEGTDVEDAIPPVAAGNRHLTELFARVNDLLGDDNGNDEEGFRPRSPATLRDSGLTHSDIERLVLKLLFSYGQLTGRQICAQLCMPYAIIEGILKGMKSDQLVQFRGTAAMGDYEFTITDPGRDRARRFMEECAYIGAAPVPLSDYLKSMEAQSIAKQEATEFDLQEAFSDLIICPKMLDRLGPAINSGRGMFLFGEPGNGKTSIAERVTGCFGSTIWIPRALGVHGEIVRLFDPGIHEEIEAEATEGIIDKSGIDQRWVQIVRPTVVAGGELTMAELEVAQNKETKVCEAPLQLKSNCGTLVIDDFGRQRMPVAELLNRWIVPLEKRYDFLNLPSGKKVQVPFDQLIVFSTNLEPRDLVDGAFLRRIPYKIQVPDPTESQFRELCELIAPHMGFEYDAESIDYLIETHYKPQNRPFRACQPRDLLLQVRNFCIYKMKPKKMSPQAFDFAVENYFSVM